MQLGTTYETNSSIHNFNVVCGLREREREGERGRERKESIEFSVPLNSSERDLGLRRNCTYRKGQLSSFTPSLAANMELSPKFKEKHDIKYLILILYDSNVHDNPQS